MSASFNEQGVNRRGLTISHVATLIRRFQREEDELHEDIDAFGAPSECHQMLRKSVQRGERRLRRRIGMKVETAMREIGNRTSSRWVSQNFKQNFA